MQRYCSLHLQRVAYCRMSRGGGDEMLELHCYATAARAASCSAWNDASSTRQAVTALTDQ